MEEVESIDDEAGTQNGVAGAETSILSPLLSQKSQKILMLSCPKKAIIGFIVTLFFLNFYLKPFAVYLLREN